MAATRTTQRSAILERTPGDKNDEKGRGGSVLKNYDTDGKEVFSMPEYMLADLNFSKIK